MNAQRNECRRGQAGLFVVLNLTLLFGLLGLAVDLGLASFKKQAAQTAADSAAMAAAIYAAQNGYTCGASGVVCASSTPCANPNVTQPTNDLQVGCLYAAANGYLNGGNGGAQSVSLSGNTTAPPGVTGNTPAYWVRATITDRSPVFFGNGGAIGALNVKASAVAGVTLTSPGACIYVLDPNASGAFTESGSASVTATCGIYVNSNSDSALTVSGSAIVRSTQILVNGKYSISGSAAITPTPTIHAGPVLDPLSTLPMPSFSGCDPRPNSVSGSGAATLNPGVYCGGISISGSGSVTFNPGLYVLNGGGLNVSGSSTLTGSDVTFFNTGQSGQTIGAISTSGSSTLTLSAPTSGTYQGMLFIQDRNPSNGPSHAISGSSGSVLTGTLYFPTSSLSYSGSSSTGSYTAIIAKTVKFTGSSSLKNDPTGHLTGLVAKSASLIQ